MSFLATTKVSILRGTVLGPYGDELDSDAVVATGVPASILERPVTGARPVGGREDTPRTYALRVWRNVELRKNDRIRDERTGVTYSVTTDAPSTNPVGLGSVRADLQRVT